MSLTFCLLLPAINILYTHTRTYLWQSRAKAQPVAFKVQAVHPPNHLLYWNRAIGTMLGKDRSMPKYQSFDHQMQKTVSDRTWHV
eukprot:1160602-Pelagomonas_calceolata.AAC.7